jgi:hypothetical protein
VIGMKQMTRFLSAALIAAALATPALADDKVLVELFTSQGCSSCPPADTFLTELAKRDDVIALSFHVDYWNYIGWKDPFSDKDFTRRQHAYRAGMSSRYVYTPQMVIDGQIDVVGSRRGQALDRIEARRSAKRLDVAARHADKDAVEVKIGAGAASGADVWLVSYDALHKTEIRRGENEGVTLKNANVVRSLRHVGNYTGQTQTLRITLDDNEMKGRSGCAVIVQKPGGGPVLGAAQLAFSTGGS